MAWTNATLTQAIQDYIESSETTMVSQIPQFIQSVERRIVKATKLPVFRKNSLGNFTASNTYLTMPSDFLAPFSLAITTTSHSYLRQKDVSFIRAAYPDTTTEGRPRFYAMFDDDTVIVGPVPDSAYDTELHYLHLPASLTLGSATWLGDNAENCMLYGCIEEALIFNKATTEDIDNYKTKFEAEILLLKSEGEGYNTSDDYSNRSKTSERV